MAGDAPAPNRVSHGPTLLLVLLLAVTPTSCARESPEPRHSPTAGPEPRLFSGALALQHATALAKIGPRPPGTPGIEKAQQYILTRLERLGVKPEVDTFTVGTPVGSRAMKNIVAKFPGRSNRAVLIAGHYDTKLETQFRFVGANDGGSSAGLLLELARVLKNSPPAWCAVWLAFLDGEEPLGGRWTPADSLYGSRRMAKQLRATGERRHLSAVLVVDMVGDRDLDLLRDLNSTGWLNELVRDVARRMRLSGVFGNLTTAVEDDHVPFSRIGLPVVDLIDMNYGPNNSFWHSAQDTPDKLSAGSLEAVGRIVLGTIGALEHRE